DITYMMADKTAGKQNGGWKDSISSTRIGSGYFLSQQSQLKFTPEEYIGFRAVKREYSNQLIQEWDRWIRDLRASSYLHVRIAASAAPSLCSEHLDAYYRDRVVAESQITSLENSSKKLADSEKELIHLTQKLRAQRNGQVEDRRSA
ncbi:hypothetical protein BGZ79_004542, partial [Entomortierella chlamydospora]